MKKIKKMILAGIALSTLFAISGCGTSKDEVNSIKVGYFNNVTHAQALLMKLEKSLENLGRISMLNGQPLMPDRQR